MDWANADLIPRSGLEAWHQYKSGESANNFAGDYSGNGRHLTCSPTNAPVLQTAVAALNNQPAWYFDGTATVPLQSPAFTATISHAFIIAAADQATFDTYRGLLDLSGTLPVLVGNPGSGNFFDYVAAAGYSMTYIKNDVELPHTAQSAPMNAAFAIIEIQSAGFAASQLQIGQQQSFTSRRWKGWFAEGIYYNRILNPFERQRLLEYFAMRYQIWPETDAGIKRFPFAADTADSRETARETYLSQPYTGPQKALIRGSFKTSLSLSFRFRRQQEFAAALAFYSQHHPLANFILRDYRFYPPADRTVRFTSSLGEQPGNTLLRFSYSFDVVEE